MNRFLSLLFLGLVLFAPGSSADPSQWENDIAAMEGRNGMQEIPQEAVIFIGSSSFRMWRTLNSDMAPLPTCNRGFGGSTIADCAFFAPRIVTRHKPSVVALYAGDNDIANGNSPEQVLADYKKFVTVIRKDLPRAAIVFVSIKPSPARWNLWEKTRKANELIQAYIKGQKNMEYIDVATPMLDKAGRVRNDLFLNDRLHMNAMGYSIWTKTLKPRLTELQKAHQQ